MSLVMEYLPHGSLIGYLKNNRSNVKTRQLLLFGSQICKVRMMYKKCASKKAITAAICKIMAMIQSTVAMTFAGEHKWYKVQDNEKQISVTYFLGKLTALRFCLFVFYNLHCLQFTQKSGL